ncbi:MAG: pantetheine-phosphate adenylyltransferase [Candidatus Izemoplasmataceae bacterium]
MKIGAYPGSFDPITYGHIDIVKRALKIFDKLYILVSVNPRKETLFSEEERITLIKHALADCLDRIEIESSHDLTVEHASKLGATHIVRGLRALTDFEYEFQMTHANRVLDKSIDSIFFMTDNKYSFLSSTSIKEIAQFDGDLSTFAPPRIAKAIKKKFNH